MGFEYGMFNEFKCPAGTSQEEAFAESFEQPDAAERWGLDAIGLAEIHMAPERSVCAAPLTIASAIAARTKNIKIGLGVQVLPLCQPLRLAEEAATVDHVSHGRLIFGVGRSGFPRAYEAYGIAYGESPERFGEVLEVVKRAWTEETFSFSGKYYNYEKVCIVPKFYRYLGARLEESANRAGVFDTARRIEGAQRLQTISWDEARRGRAIVGTPEMVADDLAGLRDRLGLAGILAELNTGGLIPHERV